MFITMSQRANRHYKTCTPTQAKFGIFMKIILTGTRELILKFSFWNHPQVTPRPSLSLTVPIMQFLDQQQEHHIWEVVIQNLRPPHSPEPGQQPNQPSKTLKGRLRCKNHSQQASTMWTGISLQAALFLKILSGIFLFLKNLL